MTRDEAFRGLQLVFNRVFGRSDITLTPELTSHDVPGWDSFRHVDFIMAAEEHFRINLRDADLDEVENIGGLAELVRELSGSAAA